VSEVSEMEDAANEKALMEAQAEQLKVALGKINPLEKAVLLMKFQDGKSIKEIVEMTQLSESAVKMRIKRAKAHALDQYQQLFQSAEQ
jgi:RNA polymerase sigma factor (sigma-70 family)